MDGSDRSIRDLRTFALVVLCVSVFFWAWAVLNTVRMESGYDLGVASFLTAAASSAYLLWRAWPDRSPPGKCAQVLVLLTHLFVSVNYVLGVMYAFEWGDAIRVGFGVYCAVFVVLWLAVGIAGYRLIEAERRATGQKQSPPGEGSKLTGGGSGSVV